MTIKSEVLPECGCPQDHPRRTRRSPAGRPGHCEDRAIRHLDEAEKEGRDALCPSQADPWPQPAPITRTMRRQRRTPPRHHRPEPQEAGQDPSCTAATAESLTGKTLAPYSVVDILRARTGGFPRNRPGTPAHMNVLGPRRSCSRHPVIMSPRSMTAASFQPADVSVKSMFFGIHSPVRITGCTSAGSTEGAACRRAGRSANKDVCKP